MKRLVILIGISLFCGVTFCQVDGESTLLLGRGAGLNSRDRARVNTTITRMNAVSTTVGVIDTDSINVAGDVVLSGVLNVDSTAEFGGWGYTGEHVVVGETSSNTNAGVGKYFMVDYDGASGKVYAAAYNRLLNMTENQTANTSHFGTESQYRLRDVDITTGVHAGIWAYAEQSGTSTLAGGSIFAAISATVESASTFTVGATEKVVGIVVDASINAGASINSSANYSGIWIKSAGKDWKTGIKFEGIDSIDMELTNGALIYNNHADSLILEEKTVSVHGDIYASGDISSGGTTSDFAITDYQPPLLEYWAKTLEINRLPAFEGKDRTSHNTYLNGLEEAAERNLRYIVRLEARLRALEAKLNE